jgi:hypothetical protein
MPKKGVDQKCIDLAKHFLLDCERTTALDELELAEHIQDAAESFIENLELDRVELPHPFGPLCNYQRPAE